jgi:hypothetical protein
MTEAAVSFAGNLTDDPEVATAKAGSCGRRSGSRLRSQGAGGVILHRGRLAGPDRARRGVAGEG